MATSTGPIEEIRLCEIRLDKTQSRAAINQEAVQDYADRLRDGGTMPPMIVYWDGTDYWLADGFHRHAAGGNLGLDTYPCEVRQGTWIDALKESARSNQTHGVRRTAEDKRHAVKILLELDEFKDASNVIVSLACGVSDWLVGDVRRLVQPNSCAGVRTGASGKKRKVTGPGPKARTTKATDQEAEETDFDPAAIEEAAPDKVDIEGLSAPYKRAVADCNRIVRDFKAVMEHPRTGVHLADKFTRIEHCLTEAKQAIYQAEPLATCGKCSGAGCKTCFHSGFWPRSVVGSRK